ncbi:MAG: histidinol dehydrogenase [Candidatus Krumholzibacteria bacterium]|nr:histidinol dehydrogenase [Candidatus Krumholzibacteria bacterium]
MSRNLLRNLRMDEARGLTGQTINQETLATAGEIIASVRRQGRDGLLELGRKFSDLGPDDQIVYTAAELKAALDRLPAEQRQLLERTAQRIADFAAAQRACLTDLSADIQGGRAGWRFMPVKRAGCYAPGGRFPLPSSVLMTTVTAKAAGVGEVWVASPRPGDLTLAAAAIGQADALIAAGGAQAIAALAYGVAGIPACDVIVGPGNKYVTAAKQLVTSQVGIDMLAGPSELVVVADDSADPATVAADLLAQAEHDPDAVPVLVALVPTLVDEVNEELDRQLESLPTANIARRALQNGGAIVVSDIRQAIEFCDDLAPEHLELMVRNADQIAEKFQSYGALFVGSATAEVLGDYGAGPNHVLPTGGTARFSGPLSVQDFLVGRNWLQMDPGPEADAVARDAVALARLEGLEAHARSAEKRLG